MRFFTLIKRLWPFGKDPRKWSEQKLAFQYAHTAAAFDDIINSPGPITYDEFDDAWRAWYTCEKEWAMRGYAPLQLDMLVQAHAARQPIYGFARPLELDVDGGVVCYAPEYLDRYMAKSTRISAPG